MDFSLICLIYVIGMVLLCLELFTPGAFLGFIGSGVLLASIILAFYYHPPIYGLILILISIIIVPLMIAWWLRKIKLNAAQNPEDGYYAGNEDWTKLIGKTGVATTMLRPAGKAKVDGMVIDVTSDNLFLPDQTPVKVVRVEGIRIVVEPLENPPTQTPS